MRAKRSSSWLTLTGAIILSVASMTAPAAAQSPAEVEPGLAAALTPGTTVWITDAAGVEQKMRIVGLSGEAITATVDDTTRRIRTAEVKRVRARHSDSIINGALIGGGVAVVTGLGMCSLTEPWENCRDDIGPMVRIAALGAAIGIAIDGLIQGRKTLYEVPRGATLVEVAPLVTRRSAGVRMALRF
jgi:hypothetical protein